MTTDDSEPTLQLILANGLGYVIGFGSLMLYTPIAIRICHQGHADGLVLSTWWLKLSSYLLTDAYFVRRRYNLSTYAETVVITVEALVVLLLVATHQKRTREASFWNLLALVATGSLYLFTAAPDGVLATGQFSAVFVNTAALLPQFRHNYTTKTKGDYSPVTASLATAGCLVRIFTTLALNGGDPVLLISFGTAFSANLALTVQILYYGVRFEGLTIWQVFSADVAGAGGRGTSDGKEEDSYDRMVGDPRDDEDDETDSVSSGSNTENVLPGRGRPSESSPLRQRTGLELC